MNFNKVDNLTDNYKLRSRDVSIIIIHSMGREIHHEGKIYLYKDWLDFLGYSAHYYIDTDGTQIKSVDPKYRALHAGYSELNGEKDLNQSSVGIELLVKDAPNIIRLYDRIHDIKNPPFTYEQYQSCALLCLELMGEFSKITIDRIVEHSYVSGVKVRPKDPKQDPGRSFSMDRLKLDIDELKEYQTT